jgi:hypothetical protein
MKPLPSKPFDLMHSPLAVHTGVRPIGTFTGMYRGHTPVSERLEGFM